MKSPSHCRRKQSKASKKKRSLKPAKNAVAKPEHEEEVVWFSNPSKEAARARREEAKDIMGRELWSKIMEDSSDEDDDGEDEKFYFYDGGWHSSPRSIKPDPLLLAEANHSAKDPQVLEFDEGSAKTVVDVVETVNQSLLNHYGEDPIKTVLNKHDPNNKNQHDNMEFGSVNDDDEEITRDVAPIVAVALFEHNGLKEQTNDEGDDNVNQQGLHNDDDDVLDLDVCRNDRATDCECGVEGINKRCKRLSSNGCFESSHVIISIESVCDDDEANDEHLGGGGFKHKIRGWIRYVGRKIRGWCAKIRRTLIPCCIVNTSHRP